MIAFEYDKEENIAGALSTIAKPDSKFIAGGTNLLDLMKVNVARPTTLVDINPLALKTIEQTESGGLKIGALVSNADLAYDATVIHDYPLLSKAILAGASAQLRNMASTGGNLLQRTRCYYFYDVGTPCNKREPGSGCSAIEGRNRIHAIFGQSEQCIAVHPSDMCVALAALAAIVHVEGKSGKRTIAFADFHRLPGDTPERDSNLESDELITAVELPSENFSEHHRYLKIRDRNSYAFALVSVATALRMDGGKIVKARLALGGVAHKPWRDPEAEAMLVGRQPSPATFKAVAEHVLKNAKGYSDNSFKIELLRRAIPRALDEAVTMNPQ